jgi:hypothetical protein
MFFHATSAKKFWPDLIIISWSDLINCSARALPQVFIIALSRGSQRKQTRSVNQRATLRRAVGVIKEAAWQVM